MAANSHIQWTDSTWSPLLGCSKVSSGCRSCYAVGHVHRMAGNPNRKIAEANAGLTAYHANGQLDWTGRIRLLPERLGLPLRWRTPRRIFVASLSDPFHPDVPFSFVAAMLAVAGLTPRHTYQWLTKRPDRMARFFAWLEERTSLAEQVFPADSWAWRRAHILHSALLNYGVDTGRRFTVQIADQGWPLRNCWMGISVEDQKAANERIPHLLTVPASIRFLSAEPLIGPLNLRPWLSLLGDNTHVAAPEERQEISWCIIGGESGKGARPMHQSWGDDLIAQCKAASIPTFVKQMGSVLAKDYGMADRKGGDINEFPREWQLREYPVVAA